MEEEVEYAQDQRGGAEHLECDPCPVGDHQEPSDEASYSASCQEMRQALLKYVINQRGFVEYRTSSAGN